MYNLAILKGALVECAVTSNGDKLACMTVIIIHKKFYHCLAYQ